MAGDRKLRKALRKARGHFVKVTPIAEHPIKLADIPVPAEAKLTRRQRQAARISGISELDYARGVELLARRRANDVA